MLRHSRSKGISDIAKQLKKSSAAITHYENGTRKLPASAVSKLSSFLKVPAEVVTVFAEYTYKKRQLKPEVFMRMALERPRNN